MYSSVFHWQGHKVSRCQRDHFQAPISYGSTWRNTHQVGVDGKLRQGKITIRYHSSNWVVMPRVVILQLLWWRPCAKPMLCCRLLTEDLIYLIGNPDAWNWRRLRPNMPGVGTQQAGGINWSCREGSICPPPLCLCCCREMG